MKYNPLTCMMEDSQKTKDVSYPKNKQQMEKVIAQYVKAVKKVEANMKMIDKFYDEYEATRNSFNGIFNYLGEEQNNWISELGKMNEVMDMDSIMQDARKLYSRI